VVVEKVHYLLPRRHCGCGTVTTAAPPFGQAGTLTTAIADWSRTNASRIHTARSAYDNRPAQPT
jgi:hypothetical protein